jgi:hypothetical protein
MANLTGQGPITAAMSTSETVGTSVGDPRVGQRYKDVDGNEYVVVDCQQAFVAGEWVYIDHAHLATRLTVDGTNGRVGVITAAVSGSDTKAYAQIYGLYSGAAGTSNVATSFFLGLQSGTSSIGVIGKVATSDATGLVINGAYAVTSPDSGATSAYATSFVAADGTSTTYIGFQVWLNYPYVIGTNFIGATS